MATNSSQRTPTAGGKIVKKRQKYKPTPYSRPMPTDPNSNNPPENPNWILSGILKPAKFIASSAAKFVSFFGNEDDYDYNYDLSENDDDDEIDNDMPFHEDDQIDKVVSTSNKSDNKRAIEQLVMQEAYSRKEANELIKLLRSRIVDTSGNVDEATPNIRTTAIMEARKWLQDKRSGSNKKLENELDASNMISPFQISRNEKGSPADMARSYMQSRPAWASPSLKSFEAGSSSPFGVLHFNEETPKSALRGSELKKSSLTSGSWNLLDEIRRVCSKATEELSATAPLTNTFLSTFSSESNQPQDILMSKRLAEGAGIGDSTHARSENVMRERDATASAALRDYDGGKAVELQDPEEAAVLIYKNNDEVKQLKSAASENGFGGSASGLAEGKGTSHEPQPSEEEYQNMVISSQGEQATNIPTDTSSMQEEELSQDFSQPVSKDGTPAKAKDKSEEVKPRRYPRRGRGQGKL